MKHLLLVVAIAIAGATELSCQVNDYCLNCATGDGGTGDGGDIAFDADPDDSTRVDGPDGGPCLPAGDEVCNGEDEDCDGTIDEDLPDIGTACIEQDGECAGAVRQCVNGVPGCTRAPVPELCDGKDNDCNGFTDEGDPGGGARCGTDAGECVAGVNRCVSGAVQCVGSMGTVGAVPEACNGLDDDCDSMIDEALVNLGACGPATDVGECTRGRLECEGGGPVCKDFVNPQFELCDDLDQDCDGDPRNNYFLPTDPQNCGTCGNVCNLPNAIEGCAGGSCTVAGCVPNFHNPDGMAANGCEIGPCTLRGPEVCNGPIDDDCDGRIDEGLTPPPVAAICLTQGACSTGTTVSCTASGYVCNYANPDVSDINNVIQPETECDAIDNDCDGRVDEGQPNLTQACTSGGTGECRTTGVFVCPAGGFGPAVCNNSTPPLPVAELCDGLDNDCDGVVDDGAELGNLPGQRWVTIPGTATQIQQYEASRPDATATGTGTAGARVCSKAGVRPWTNITYPQAVAACTSINARLCTEAEWENMCSQIPAVTYPVAGPTGLADFVFLEAENAELRVAQTSGGTSRSWVNDQTSLYSGVRNVLATPDTGANVSAANAPTQSPRLDFRVTFATAADYHVWVRVYATSADDNSLYAGINATAPGTVDNFAMTPASQNLQQWKWVVSRAIAVTAGVRTVSVFMREDGVRVDAIAVTRDGVNEPPYNANVWAYQTNPKLPQPTTCNGDDFDTNAVLAGDQDDILSTGSLGQCFANGTGINDASDLSGNVKEWTARRAPNANPLRGGASNSTLQGLTCALDFTLANDQFFFPNVGFRCCR